MSSLMASARRRSHGRLMSVLARTGLVARALVYLVIGWLAVRIAQGRSDHEADQRGAFADIAQHTAGLVLLWLLGIGFAAYALWRFVEAGFGKADSGQQTGPRLQSAFSGITYTVLAVSTFGFIAGTARQSQAQQQATLTARVMRHTGGRWLVGLVGAIVLAVGIAMIVEGVRRKFEDDLDLRRLSEKTRAVVIALGTIGTVARGLVVGLVGVLIGQAAISFKPQKSTGLDGALRTVAGRSYGPWLLGAVAVGLIAFALFGFAQARWTKV